MANGTYITALDNGSSLYAGYAIYNAERELSRLVLYNSVYYTGNGTRPVHDFHVEGLEGCGGVAGVRRLTAQSTLSRQDEGGNPTFAGQSFANATCKVFGPEVVERVKVVDGKAGFRVAASEAVIVDL